VLRVPRAQPTAYVRLPANLVRAALLRSDPAIATVGGVARHHGFSELGRCGSLPAAFGESPSTTLHGRSPVGRSARSPIDRRQARRSATTDRRTVTGGRAAWLWLAEN
jgi:hypothetical protein